jgi:hypothetical protein
MGRDSSASAGGARWLGLLLLLATSSLCSAVRDRTGAFIGYSEAVVPGYGMCSNKMDNCEHEAAMNKCLTDPFRMRRLCPVSCLVEPCVSQGSVLVSWVASSCVPGRSITVHRVLIEMVSLLAVLDVR